MGFLGWEDPLEEEMATHSSVLSWRNYMDKEPGGLQFIGLQRVRHDWSDLARIHKLEILSVKSHLSYLQSNSSHLLVSYKPWCLYIFYIIFSNSMHSSKCYSLCRAWQLSSIKSNLFSTKCVLTLVLGTLGNNGKSTVAPVYLSVPLKTIYYNELWQTLHLVITVAQLNYFRCLINYIIMNYWIDIKSHGFMALFSSMPHVRKSHDFLLLFIKTIFNKRKSRKAQGI